MRSPEKRLIEYAVTKNEILAPERLLRLTATCG
jgi:hypothetical protein